MERPDSAEFRTVLGSYATGVAVATCTDQSGRTGAMTINSFTSLSLDPPLVLWSIAKDCDQAPYFAGASHYAINILAQHQRTLSDRLASPGTDKLKDVPHALRAGQAPVLPDCCANLVCEIIDRHEGGDHVILIGKVVAMRGSDAPPLIFSRGQYRELA